MKLLPENELIWSWVVANSKMNRERNASGINSYEQELGFKPETFLEKRVGETGVVKWLDLCCGEGKALIQTAAYLAEYGLQEKAMLTGIDLVDAFQPIPSSLTCISFEKGSLVDYTFTEQYDLITCIHGLHYVGDKLKVLKTVLERLQPNGLFIANIDLNNIQVKNNDTVRLLGNLFKKFDIRYDRSTKLLSCNGPRLVDFNLNYIGASDEAGPNYTGQDAVLSVYED